jgi:hypothetical protein
VTRDSLHYRKLTDKPRAKEEDSKDSDKMKDIVKERSKEKDPAAGEALAALAFGMYLNCISCFMFFFPPNLSYLYHSKVIVGMYERNLFIPPPPPFCYLRLLTSLCCMI